MLSFDSPMREHTGLCTIRSMAQTLCYDLARAEKAKDGKKSMATSIVALKLIIARLLFQVSTA